MITAVPRRRPLLCSPEALRPASARVARLALATALAAGGLLNCGTGLSAAGRGIGVMGGDAQGGTGSTPADAGTGGGDQGETPGGSPGPLDPGTATSPVASSDPASAATAPAAGSGFRDRYAFRGRFDFSDRAGPRFAWPNSAIGANFTGSSLTLRLVDPLPTTYNGVAVNNRYDVTIDQRPSVKVAIVPGTTDYPIALDLPAGPHTVWVSKRTEANIGRGQFLGMALAANGIFLTPPAARSRFIEFVGDSASSGYGADGNSKRWNDCTFSVDTANSSIAYPRVAADLLGADFHNVAFAGKGITRNRSPADPVLTMPVIYALWDPRDDQTRYDFSRPAADVAVINVGGNDWTSDSLVLIPPNQQQFTAKYLQLIQSVRQHAPTATIFCAVTSQAHGKDRATYIAYLKAVVEEASKQGDVRFFEFREYNGELGWGCDGHPSAASSQNMAQQLVAAIKAAHGW